MSLLILSIGDKEFPRSARDIFSPVTHRGLFFGEVRVLQMRCARCSNSQPLFVGTWGGKGGIEV